MSQLKKIRNAQNLPTSLKDIYVYMKTTLVPREDHNGTT